MTVFWILGALLLIALLQYVLYRHWGLKRIGYTRRFDKSAVFAGDSLEMIEVISNMKLLMLPWLKVETHMSGSLVFNSTSPNTSIVDDIYHNSMFFMGPYKRITRVHKVTATRRGYYEIPTVSITTGDALGFVTVSQSRPVSLALSVYPALLDFSVLEMDSHRWQGDVVMRRFIEPDPFLINGIRPWQIGDSLRDVHWPATARTGELQVKTRDYTASPKMLVLLNVQMDESQWGAQLDPQQSARMENALSLCATYAAWAHQHHIENGFACNGRFSRFSNEEIDSGMSWGETHFIEIMELMARIKFYRRVPFHTYLAALSTNRLTDTDIIVVSAYWSEALEEQAQALRARNNSVRWVKAAEQEVSHEAAS